MARQENTSPTSATRKKSSGISTRLYLSFLVVAAFTVVTALIAGFSFSVVKKKQHQISNESLPAITAALKLSERIAGLAAAAPTMTAAKDLKGLKALKIKLDKDLNKIKGGVSSFKGEEETLGQINQILNQMGKTLSSLEKAMAERLSSQEKVDAFLSQALEAQGAINDSLGGMVVEANTAILLAIEGDEVVGATASPEDAKKFLTQYQNLLNVRSQANSSVALLMEAASKSDPAQLKKVEKRYNGSNKRLIVWAKRLIPSDEIKQLQDHVGKLSNINKDGQFFGAVHALAKSQSSAAKALNISRALAKSLVVKSESLSLSMQAAADQATQESNASIDNGQKSMWGFAVFSVVLALLISWLYVGRQIVGRLRLLHNSMVQLADGNLDITLPKVSKDEIGDMVESLSVFRENLHHNAQLQKEQENAQQEARKERQKARLELADNLEQRIDSIVQSLSSSVDKVEHNSKNLADNAGKARSESEAVSETIQLVSSNMQGVSSAGEQLSTSIRAITSRVDSATEAVSEATEEANAANQRIKDLAEAAGRVGQIIQLINDIAEQTNLLALNATIEAARAGEAGKGFAVVATEVKNLATQTANATEEISSQISGIQNQTDKAVTAIDHISGTIGRIQEISVSIAEALDEQGEATRNIASHVLETSDNVSNANQRIQDVTNAAGRNGQLADDMFDLSSNLQVEKDNLSGEVEQFLSELRQG